MVRDARSFRRYDTDRKGGGRKSYLRLVREGYELSDDEREVQAEEDM